MNLIEVEGNGDRRGAKRYPVVLPIELENGIGSTCDVSTSGVFFEVDRPFDAGASIEFSLVLEQLGKNVTRRLYCEGKVVRVERCGKQWKVAVSINSFRFEG